MVENGSSFTLTAVPKKESFNTTFAIEYWTDGAKDKTAAVFLEIAAHDEKAKESLLAVDGGGGLPISLIILVAGVLTVIAIFFVVKKKMAGKGNVDT